ncbi:UvrD-helicase domain-containing protein [Dactylosporangium sp. NPDC050588]|uniref:Putative ATP-dependent DNA helicase n=1 Tax=Dactylosporangium aurantiacum subsp. hamdenensis TaxID=703577 RepID=E9LIN4_9ACTN|nr:putative ATP-dependent DNA helicase [Dactylosporangium aurantiacum subsp. hamdenensis]
MALLSRVSSEASTAFANDTLEDERRYVAMLYRNVDTLRDVAAQRLARTQLHSASNPSARAERDASATMYRERIRQLEGVDERLCFGRLDLDDGETRYVGRVGLVDEEDQSSLLMDWRAPAARPYYLANAITREGVRRRRQLQMKGRTVLDYDDEFLDVDAAPADSATSLTNEAALMAALTADRTGQMRDIVATIQGEQDEIIRADINGVLVVQGGPGTGKTAVALHRVAYLLYAHRDRLEKRGAMILGPNATFLRYISQVLPSLGETGALLCTVGDLYPGVVATGSEPDDVAEIKGRASMVQVMANAVYDRQETPPVKEVRFEGDRLRLTQKITANAKRLARDTLRPHNEARPYFVREIIEALTNQVAANIGRNLLVDDDIEQIRFDLTRSPEVHQALRELWPILTPEQLLADLYASPERIEAATPDLAAAERELLLRDPKAPWTPGDVPLLDEAAELLGWDDRAERAREAAQWDADLEYAQGVLQILNYDEDEIDEEVLQATDVIDASTLADRHDDDGYLSVSERAAADRTWAFGHIVVDEAQELSPMVWRLLMRRSPSRSMTVVGDVAQTSDPSGTTTWGDVFAPYVADRWRLTELTVNYRTPAEVMAVAADVLAAISPGLTPPRSARTSGITPWCARVDAYVDAAPEAVHAETTAVGGGQVAVIAPTELVHPLGAAIRDRTTAEVVVGDGISLGAGIVVLDARQAKGLEFDSVLVVDPAGIVNESRRGLSDLYVALTRTTKRLGVLHRGDLPAELRRLSPRDTTQPTAATEHDRADEGAR